MTAIQKQQNPSVVDGVIKRVNELKDLGELRLPQDYAAENAVRAAWLILQEQKNRDNKPILSVATRDSVANAMFNMVIQGLSVVKKQGDFILYGDKLTFQREYHGNKALAKRFGKVADITHNSVFEDDTLEYIIDKNGRKQVTKHDQKITNIDMEKIVGAYAVVTYEDDTTQAEIMTIKQIKQSWLQGATKGQSPAHKNFPDRMAEKTVANRLLTSIINASDDAAIFSDDERQERSQQVAAEKQEREVKAISFDEAVEVDSEYYADEPQNKDDNKPTEKVKSESKPNTSKEKEKPVKQPETLFDGDVNNDNEPF